MSELPEARVVRAPRALAPGPRALGWRTTIRLLFGVEGAQGFWLGALAFAVAGGFLYAHARHDLLHVRIWALAPMLIAVVLAAIALVGGLRMRRLVARGVPTEGRRLGVRELFREYQNGGRELVGYACTFSYEALGKRHEIEIETANPAALQDDRTEPMVFDPGRPQRATTLDNLPGAIRVAPDGSLEAATGMPLYLLVIPLAMVAVIAVDLVRWW